MNSNGTVNVGTPAVGGSTARLRIDQQESLGYGVYAVFARAIGSGVIRYGIYSNAAGGAYNYALYSSAATGSSNYAGYFYGNVTVTGTFSNPSDDRLKEGVASLRDTDAVSRLLRVRPTNYVFRTDAELVNLPSGVRYGFLANEMEEIFPELVHNNIHPPKIDGEGNLTREAYEYQSVDYLSLVPILVQAIQEQQEQIEAMRAALEANGISIN